MGRIELERIHASGLGHINIKLLLEFGTAAILGWRSTMLT